MGKVSRRGLLLGLGSGAAVSLLGRPASATVVRSVSLPALVQGSSRIVVMTALAAESHFEELLRLDDGDPDCPECGSGKTRRQLSVFAAHGTAGQPSFGGSSGGGCCGGGCGCGS